MPSQSPFAQDALFGFLDRGKDQKPVALAHAALRHLPSDAAPRELDRLHADSGRGRPHRLREHNKRLSEGLANPLLIVNGIGWHHWNGSEWIEEPILPIGAAAVQQALG